MLLRVVTLPWWASVLALLSLQPACVAVADGPAGSSPGSDAPAANQGQDGPRLPEASDRSACSTSADGTPAADAEAFALGSESELRANSRPKFVYAANQNSNDVSTYAVNASGSLSAIGTPVGVGKYPEAIALLPNGTGLFVANHGSNTVSVFKADSKTGVLSAGRPGIASAAAGPIAIAVHPGGHFVYVGSDDATSRTPNRVTAYQVNPDISGLTRVGANNTDGAGLLAMSVAPSGRFLYTANTLSDDISAFAIDRCSGALVKVGTNAASAFPVSLSVHPAGKYLYVASGGSEPSIQTFAIGESSGALHQIHELKGVSLPWELKGLQLDRTGKFLFAVTVGRAGASHLSTYAIDSETGVPSAAHAACAAAGTNAAPIAIDQSGRFAYVGNFGSNDISAYAVDRGTGTFTAIGTVPAGAAPGALAVSSGEALM